LCEDLGGAVAHRDGRALVLACIRRAISVVVGTIVEGGVM
jgi:hypothetical protein